jgi:hypothetical protein
MYNIVLQSTACLAEQCSYGGHEQAWSTTDLILFEHGEGLHVPHFNPVGCVGRGVPHVPGVAPPDTVCWLAPFCADELRSNGVPDALTVSLPVRSCELHTRLDHLQVCWNVCRPRACLPVRDSNRCSRLCRLCRHVSSCCAWCACACVGRGGVRQLGVRVSGGGNLRVPPRLQRLLQI